MTQINSPAGRLVQGTLKMQQRKDMKTQALLVKPDGSPDMGCFFSLAFPKITDGVPNPEFAKFYGALAVEAAAAWPQFFPQGASGPSSNPKFAWKVQDGDGNDSNGQSVAAKPGFKDHWIVKFDTNYMPPVFNEGAWRPDQELQNPDTIVKRGYWVRVVGEVKSNNSDVSKQQVPGIVIYPQLVSFLGGRPEDVITSGPDAATAFGASTPAWRPAGISTVPGAPVGGLPTPPSLAVPQVLAAPVAPTYAVRADLAAQGHTVASLAAAGTTEQLVAAGYLVVVAPVAPALPQLPQLPVAPVALSAPAFPGLPTPPGLPALPGAPALPVPPAVLTPPAPTYALLPAFVQQGASIEGLIAKGWTMQALIDAGHVTRVG